jgi:hypothetical protein
VLADRGIERQCAAVRELEHEHREQQLRRAA